jgi:hypothetical protein
MAAGVHFDGAVKAHPSGYRLYDLDYPYIQVIEKSLFDEVWKAIKENNHDEIRRLKTEHPELTIYSGYHNQRVLKTYFKDGVEIHLGSIHTLLTEFSNQTYFDKFSYDDEGMWTTTTETHQLLFDLGFIQRDDAYVIWNLLHLGFSLEEKETAVEFVSRFMDAEAIRKSAFHFGATGRLCDFHSWKTFVDPLRVWYHHPERPETLEGYHRTIRHNDVDKKLAPYLVVGNDFEDGIV